MSFRDELDAALVQIDALRRENAALRGATPPAATARRRGSARVAWGAAACVLAGLVVLLASHRGPPHAMHARRAATWATHPAPLDPVSTPRGWLWIVLPTAPGPLPLEARVDAQPVELVWTDDWARAFTAQIDAESFFAPRCVRVPSAVYFRTHRMSFDAPPASPAALLRCGPYRAESSHDVELRSAAGASLWHQRVSAGDTWDQAEWTRCREAHPSGC